jgi:PAS domain S-box-containing protein
MVGGLSRPESDHCRKDCRMAVCLPAMELFIVLHIEFTGTCVLLLHSAASAVKLAWQRSTQEMDATTLITDRRIGKSHIRGLLPALLVAVGYYCGARIGFALTFDPVPISILWPPNAVLLAGLLLSPLNSWWLILVAVFPAHLVIQLQSGVPLEMALGWYITNCSEALLGAAFVHRILRQRLRFDTFRHVIVFLVCCAFLAPFASTFLDVTLVKIMGWGTRGFWQLWQLRFFSNVVAMLIVVPALVTWSADVLPSMRKATFIRQLEGSLLACALLGISGAVFISGFAPMGFVPLLLYAPLPILLWSAVRFEPSITSILFLLFTFLAVWGTLLSQGPFVAGPHFVNALSLQLFLISVSVPLLLLSASIQERRKSQETLRHQEEKLGLALAAAQIGIWDMDRASDKGAWSLELKDIFGIKESGSKFSLDTFLSQIYPEDRAATRRIINQASAQCSSFETEFRIVRPDGKLRWVLSKGKALCDNAGRPVRTLGVAIDVTERKLADVLAREKAALYESEARFRQMADAMPQIVWAARADGQVDYVNRKWRDSTGMQEWPSGDQMRLPFIHPDDRQRYLDQWHQAVAGGQIFEAEYRIFFPRTKTYRWHLARALPVRNEDGKPVHWYGTSTDIDAQKCAEHAQQAIREDLEHRVAERTVELIHANDELKSEIEGRKKAVEAERISEARFSKVFRLSPDAMCISSGIQGTILDVNERWQTLFGYERDEVIGNTAQQLNLYASEKNLATLLDRNREWGFIRDLDVEMRDKEGHILDTVISGGKIDIDDESCFITILRDVTEQRRAENEVQTQREQLTHLTRVVVLGELSGALAHELNQPLAAILTNAQAARRFMSRQPVDLNEIREILDDIVDEDKRAGEVIRRLRALFMKGEPKMQPLEINELVREALELTHSDLIERKVPVTLQLGSGPGVVQGDRVQLQQVLLNLIVNACEAMSGRPPETRRLNLATDSDVNGNVQLTVTDTGSGIAPDVSDKMFESFFTTKAHGMGFGLSISHAIIAEHGGRIGAENNPGGGATFRISLPAAHMGALS